MDLVLNFISENIVMIYILVLAIFLGMEVISKVPTVLHTPLMSGANAVSGVVIIGAIWLIRNAEPDNYFVLIIGFLGIAMGGKFLPLAVLMFFYLLATTVIKAFSKSLNLLVFLLAASIQNIILFGYLSSWKLEVIPVFILCLFILLSTLGYYLGKLINARNI